MGQAGSHADQCSDLATVMQSGSTLNASAVDIGRGGFLYNCGAAFGSQPVPAQNIQVTPTNVNVTMQPGMYFAKSFNSNAPVQPRNLTIVCNK